MHSPTCKHLIGGRFREDYRHYRTPIIVTSNNFIYSQRPRQLFQQHSCFACKTFSTPVDCSFELLRLLRSLSSNYTQTIKPLYHSTEKPAQTLYQYMAPVVFYPVALPRDNAIEDAAITLQELMEFLLPDTTTSENISFSDIIWELS